MGVNFSQNELLQSPPPPSEVVTRNPKAKETTKTTTDQVKLPHNYETILKEADSPPDTSAIDHLYENLYAGVYLNQKRKKYWIEKETNINCFMVFARDLSITWGNDSRYWNWPFLKESTTSEEYVDVAELLNVCWLEVSGKFDITKLSPGVKYEVGFEVMLKEPCYGFNVPVSICLTPPDKNKKPSQVNLKDKLRKQWIKIPVGDFETPFPEKGGEIEFSLHEYESGKWKKGLVIKGVFIQPKQ